MNFNLSEWALRNRPLVAYFALALALIGTWSYFRLGQSEDPPFTFKAMVVRTLWPGATAEQIALQVNERIETKLQETGQYDYIRSYARPGESVVLFIARDDLPSSAKPALWYQVRKKIGDIRHTLPPGIVGPFFNDEFGDTFGNIYALSGDGFDDAQLKDWARRVQLELLRVPDVAKVELIGLQDERIWIELSNAKIATLGVSFDEVVRALEAQNAVVPAGFFETGSDRIYLRASGAFDSVDSIRDLSIRAGDRLFKLGDVAEVRRGFADPPAPRMRHDGREVIGLGVSMAPGGDIIRLGEALEAATTRLQQSLPVGLSLDQVADQPRAVRSSVAEFVRVLVEAVAIVLLVSFISLGFRTGMVVALSIPLVLAMTFAGMKYFGIDLHKISLGALVLALGLLVDDAIIAVEMMAVKLEQGYDRIKAAAAAWDSTAFPMLTGTLVTAAGFLPIATAHSATGEYTRSIFEVVTLALLLSWVAAVVFIPWLGWKLLPERGAAHAATPAHDPYDTPFYRRFRALVGWCLDRRGLVITATAGLFALSVAGFGVVQQQFFPASTRLELMVDFKLGEGASLAATDAVARRFERALARDEFKDDVVGQTAYVGTGAPRFYLPLDQQLPQASFAQFVLATRDVEARERVRERLFTLLAAEFSDVRTRVARLENGPPVGYPVQFRVSGEDIPTVRALAREVAQVVRAEPGATNVHLDWDEPSKIIRLDIDQERARVLGVSSQDLANFVQSSLSGSKVSLFRDGDELIDIVLRGPAEERARLSLLEDLSVPTASGRSVPLAQIATAVPGFEEGIIWRRDRLPTITVRADVVGDVQPPTVAARIQPGLAPIQARLPAGYRIETGGVVEDSARAQRSVVAGIPLFVFAVTTLLMFQLRSFSRVAMVWLTAPLGLIGVTAFLLLFGQPFGFVAMLGTIALSGMIMRNSVILVDQIEHDIAAGHHPWEAIVEATVRRFRPIVLTALAAVLAMIPLTRSVFFGPMAVAIMGGLVSATALTVLFLPALYAAWFRIAPPQHPVPPPRTVDAWPGNEIEVARP
ncbi:MAG: efflux RND transporter permease subunit [Xanthomonadaceae bacterium]|jgi:multidrug efflux pump|nr:efflux RND transporter permease subunit [Xanthomonadaceae bacterium]